jgi:hypothetical protein
VPFGWASLTLGWWRGFQLASKLSDMSWARGVDLEPSKESLYGEFLGADWREVEPGIFVRAEAVELDSPRLQAAPATSR